MDQQQGQAAPASIVVQRRRERIRRPADDWAVRGWCWSPFQLIDCRCLLIEHFSAYKHSPAGRHRYYFMVKDMEIELKAFLRR